MALLCFFFFKKSCPDRYVEFFKSRPKIPNISLNVSNILSELVCSNQELNKVQTLHLIDEALKSFSLLNV